MADVARAIGRHALPQICALCAARAGNALVCRACAEALPWLQAACPVCALPTPGAAVCGLCLRKPPAFSATTAAFVYAFPVDRLLHELKYAGRLAFADWAAEALAAVVGGALDARDPTACPGVIAPMPLAPARQRERGFNQAQEIAVRVAGALELPNRPLLTRVDRGVPQAALPWARRAANVRDVFACSADVRGLGVALVDDVMTTGATLEAAAAALRRAGAARVECWVVARTLPPGPAR